MRLNQGPVNFNRALKWFIDTYGYSAEVRHYSEIKKYYRSMKQFGISPAVPDSVDDNVFCNPLWSWTLGYNDLRVYVANEREVVFFQLAHPIDQ